MLKIYHNLESFLSIKEGLVTRSCSLVQHRFYHRRTIVLSSPGEIARHQFPVSSVHSRYRDRLDHRGSSLITRGLKKVAAPF